jgi:hypothetical protein
MNAFWSYFWPVFAAGLTFGLIAATGAFRLRIVRVRERPNEPDFVRPPRRRRIVFLVSGVLASMGSAALWHGPLGAADRFSSRVERIARQVLIDYEAPAGITAHVHHGLLTRQLILSGPGDDFQRAETARLLSQIPGVSDAAWTPSTALPLIVEGIAVSLLGFLSGLLLAYLIERRRRHNAQWSW